MESTQETTQIPEDSSIATDPTSVTEAVELEGKELRVGYAFQGKGIYEVHNRMYVRGTAEALVDTFVGMLKALV